MLKFIKKHWIVISIIILAIFTRFYKIYDYAEFLGDQGRDVVIVSYFLKNGDLFFIGPQTSIGNMYLGPFYYYLFMVPGLLLSWFNPLGPALIVAALGVLTVFFVYHYSQEWFNTQTAIVASLLYALSPVVIKYSTFSWNPNIMPLFALLFIHFILQKKYIYASIAFIICLNSHFLALLLLPTALIIMVYQKSFPVKELLIALAIFLISLTPQILFDIKHQGQNINAFIHFFSQRETTINLKPYKAIPLVVPLFNQVNTRLLAGKDTNFGYLLSLIFLTLIVVDIFSQYRHRRPNIYLIALYLWLAISLVGLALYKQHIYDHYFGFIYPAVIILFSYLITRLPPLVFTPILILTISFSLIQNPLRWPAPRQMATTLQITRSIVDSAGTEPFNFSLLAKMNYDPGYRYYFQLNDAPVQLLQNKITEQLFVVCEPFQIDCQPINNPEWSIAAFGWAKVDKQWEINGIKIFRLVHNVDIKKT
ncbi:MAG: glycosyltransferase family 39 protein [Microgenomates group bacterium]